MVLGNSMGAAGTGGEGGVLAIFTSHGALEEPPAQPEPNPGPGEQEKSNP